MDATEYVMQHPDEQTDPYAADKLEEQMAVEAMKSGTPVHEPDKKEFDDAVLETGLI